MERKGIPDKAHGPAVRLGRVLLRCWDPCQSIQCDPLSSCPESAKVCVVVERAPFVPNSKK